MQVLSANTRNYLRNLLVLGRASNLPTVWSNCLAGWMLGGGGPISGLLLLCLGATCMYVGGMYLNDAFDLNFDRHHRPERPIPSGVITVGEVWGFGLGWLVLGSVMLFLFGLTTAILAVLLLLSILLYDWTHKMIAFSPLLMALCRLFLFLAAASTGDQGITGLAIWTALALGCYIVGLSYVAKFESTRGALKYWPCILLAAPLFLGWLANQGEYKLRGIFLGGLVGLWILWSLHFSYWDKEKKVGRTVSGLLAGIVLVDLLSLAGEPVFLGFLLVLLFVSALVFQRFIPAT